MATKLFSVRHQNYEIATPFTPEDIAQTVNDYRTYLAGLVGGNAPSGVSDLPFAVFSFDEVQAGATLVDNGLTGGDVAGATINGVDCTATYASSPNNTLTLIKNKINAGGNTPNDLVTKAVSAVRYFTDATGYFTMSACPAGTVTPAVDGTNVPFTATGVDAEDAAALALAINAQATAGKKVWAYSDGVDKTYVVAQSTGRAVLTLSSAAGTVGVRINGFLTTVEYATSDAATATALTAAINANTQVNRTVRAVNTGSGEVTVIATTAGDLMPAVGARGTGVTVGGTATPSTTLTISSASGTLTAYINGVPVAAVTATGTDATDAALLAAAINASTFAQLYVRATVSAGVVTVTALNAIPVEAYGTGVSSASAYLTNAGTYGGVAGNALTLTSANASYCIRSGATLSGGVSGLAVTATKFGVAGNWITFAAGGAAASHLTASGTALTAGAETVFSAGF